MGRADGTIWVVLLGLTAWAAVRWVYFRFGPAYGWAFHAAGQISTAALCILLFVLAYRSYRSGPKPPTGP